MSGRIGNRVIAWTLALVALAGWALWWSSSSAPGEAPGLAPIASVEAQADAPAAYAAQRTRVPGNEVAAPSAPLAEIDASSPDTESTSEAEAPCLLYGSVRDTRGFPVELDRVEIRVRAPRSREAEPVEELGPGRFCVRGSMTGTWSVRTKARDFLEWKQTIRVNEGGGPYELDIVLEPCLGLDVFLATASGEPLAEPARRLLAETHFCQLRVGRTCAEASTWRARIEIDRELEGVPAHLGFVRVEELGASSVCLQLQVGSELLDTRTVSAGADSVTFTLPDSGESLAPASVSFRLVGELSGEPPSFVTVEVQVAGITVLPAFNNRNAEGLVELTDLPPGRIALTIRAADHGWKKMELTLQPGEHRDLGEVALAELTPLRVSVVSADGVPVPGARVGIFPLPWSPGYSSSYHYATEDDGADPGRFTLQPQTEYSALRATHAGSCSRTVRARAGDAVVLVLEPSSFEASLTLRGIDGSTWWLVNADGLPVSQGWIPSTKVASAPVLPGRYTVHVVTPDEDASSFPVTLDAP